MIFLFALNFGLPCSHCDERISPNAHVCPKCTRDLDENYEWQRRLRARRTFTNVFTAIVLILVGAVVIIAVVAQVRQESSRREEEAAASKTRQQATVAVTNGAPRPVAPASTPAFVADDRFVRLIKPTTISNNDGSLRLQPGTQVWLIGRRNDGTALIRYGTDSRSYAIPLSSTDIASR